MKRKLTIGLIAGATFLSTIGGGASILATVPDSMELGPSVQIQENHTEKTPIAIAGGSWGGKTDGSDDGESESDLSPTDGGGGTDEGGSWGG